MTAIRCIKKAHQKQNALAAGTNKKNPVWFIRSHLPVGRMKSGNSYRQGAHDKETKL
jgi:hypothetical protein